MKASAILFALSVFLFVSCGKENTPNEPSTPTCQSVDDVITSIDVVNSPCGETKGQIAIQSKIAAEYSIDDKNFQSSSVFKNLAPAQYDVTIRKGDCTWRKEVVVVSGISLSGEIRDIIGTHCATSGCHVTGVRSPDLTMKSNILSAASRMEGNITGNLMPPPNSGGPKLSKTDKEKLLCWIRDGAKDN